MCQYGASPILQGSALFNPPPLLPCRSAAESSKFIASQMLRFLYLSCLYWKQRENRCQVWLGRRSAIEDQNRTRKLKRRIILRKLGPWTLFSSIIADFDVVADWLFYASDVYTKGGVIQVVGLGFAVLGTFLWFMLVTEGHILDWGVQCFFSSGGCSRKREQQQLQQHHDEMPLGILEHISLKWQMGLNVVFEDIPQLIVTLLVENSINTATGVFNVTTSAFSFLAKVADVLEASRDSAPMAVQLRMVDIESGVTETLLDAQDELEKQAEKAAGVVAALAGLAKDSEEERSRNMFRVLQLAPQHVVIVKRRFKERHCSIKRKPQRSFENFVRVC